MSANTILRHNLILQRLRQSPATISEILTFIELRMEAEHERQKPNVRTFGRDKNDILRLYRIDIRFRHSDKRYYLVEEDASNLGDRIIEAYNIGNLLKLPEASSGQILFEKRRPNGTELFDKLLQAIRQRLVVRYTYQVYAELTITERTVYPYALKEFRGRWYLLASETREGMIKSFGLDRIAGLEITKQTFKTPKGLNPEQKYRDCFGITGPNSEAPSSIVLSFEPVAGRYIKSFPLHHSQELLVDNEEEIRIALQLYITQDFIMEILSYGARVKVLAPTALKTLLRQEHLQALEALEAMDAMAA